jgi:hypothetical protein
MKKIKIINIDINTEVKDYSKVEYFIDLELNVYKVKSTALDFDLILLPHLKAEFN